MKENFQNAYDVMIKLSRHAKEGADLFPSDSSFKYTWNEKSEVYKNCADLLMVACTCAGVNIETEKQPVKEANVHPVFENILNNIKAAS